MIFKKTRAIISPAVKVDLSFDEHRRVAAVVTILINIEKRAIANNRNTKKTITKKIKRGSQYSGPLRLSSGQASFYYTALSFIRDLFKFTAR